MPLLHYTYYFRLGEGWGGEFAPTVVGLALMKAAISTQRGQLVYRHSTQTNQSISKSQKLPPLLAAI